MTDIAGSYLNFIKIYLLTYLLTALLVIDN